MGKEKKIYIFYPNKIKPFLSFNYLFICFLILYSDKKLGSKINIHFGYNIANNS